jgi:hypothetical protein
VEDGAGELVEAGDIGHRRLVQRPCAPDHGTRVDLRSVRELQDPVPARPARRADLGAETDAPAQVEAVGDVLEVGADLRLPRERARPSRVGGEGERVQVRLHVARAARVGVVAPGAAEGVALLQDEEIAAACRGEPRRRPEAGEPAAHDRDVHALLLGPGHVHRLLREVLPPVSYHE